jgi:hypothetical protein
MFARAERPLPYLLACISSLNPILRRLLLIGCQISMERDSSHDYASAFGTTDHIVEWDIIDRFHRLNL